MIHANCGATASTTYMIIMELFDEYPAPFSLEMMMIVIDHNTNINILNDIILSMATERSTNLKLAVEGNRFWSRTIITTILLLSWHGD